MQVGEVKCIKNIKFFHLQSGNIARAKSVTLNEGHLNYKDFFVEENGIIFPKTDIEERRDFRKRRKRLRQLRNNL